MEASRAWNLGIPVRGLMIHGWKTQGRPDSITQRFNLKIRSSGLPPWNCATRYGSRASSGGGSEVDVMMY